MELALAFDLHHDEVAGVGVLESVDEVFDGLYGRSVDAVDDVSGLEVGLDGGGLDGAANDQSAGRLPQLVSDHAGDLLIDGGYDDSQRTENRLLW